MNFSESLEIKEVKEPDDSGSVTCNDAHEQLEGKSISFPFIYQESITRCDAFNCS